MAKFLVSLRQASVDLYEVEIDDDEVVELTTPEDDGTEWLHDDGFDDTRLIEEFYERISELSPKDTKWSVFEIDEYEKID